MRSSVGVSAILIIVIAIGDLAVAAPPARKTTRSIDCRRLVFHPQCRGVAAKRAAAVAEPPLPILLEPQYERDPDMASEQAPGPGPGQVSAPSRMQQALPVIGVEYLSSDRLLSALLSRIASERQYQGRHGNDNNVNDILNSESADNTDKSEYGRVDWQPPQPRSQPPQPRLQPRSQPRSQRKRAEVAPPEVSFDY